MLSDNCRLIKTYVWTGRGGEDTAKEKREVCVSERDEGERMGLHERRKIKYVSGQRLATEWHTHTQFSVYLIHLYLKTNCFASTSVVAWDNQYEGLTNYIYFNANANEVLMNTETDVQHTNTHTHSLRPKTTINIINEEVSTSTQPIHIIKSLTTWSL